MAVPNLNRSDGNVDVNGLTTFLTGLEASVGSGRRTKRVGLITPAAAPAINTDVLDVAKILAMTVAITNLSTNLTGTPQNEDPLMIVFSSASSLAISHGASFLAGPAPLLTATAAGKTHRAFYVWDVVVSKWLCMASDANGY